jgi:RNA polymerase sigma-70 factor (ECF subfamily)
VSALADEPPSGNVVAPADRAAEHGTASDARADLALVRKLVAGDGSAWRVLVSGYQRLVLARVAATARELNQGLGSADAEDLCAEVFSQLVRDEFAALKRFEGRSSLATWLCVVTRRIVLRRLVVARREPAQPGAQPPVLETLPNPASEEPLSVIISVEDRKRLAAEIARLSERHQELARLFYMEGRSYREISQQLGISMNSIGPTLQRVHEKLRAAMEGGE